MGHKEQIGAIVYGAGINVRAYVEYFKARGFVVIFNAGYAGVYKP